MYICYPVLQYINHIFFYYYICIKFFHTYSSTGTCVYMYVCMYVCMYVVPVPGTFFTFTVIYRTCTAHDLRQQKSTKFFTRISNYRYRVVSFSSTQKVRVPEISFIVLLHVFHHLLQRYICIYIYIYIQILKLIASLLLRLFVKTE